MGYSDFGLDVQKKNADDSELSKIYYCPFCDNDSYSYGFYLCFSNWIICKHCLDHACDVDRHHLWHEANLCFKCKQKDVIAMRNTNDAIDICKDCIDWGKESINKHINKSLF